MADNLYTYQSLNLPRALTSKNSHYKTSITLFNRIGFAREALSDRSVKRVSVLLL